MNDDQMEMLLLAGMFSARRWPINPKTLKFIRVPDGVHTYHLASIKYDWTSWAEDGRREPAQRQERIELERFVHESGAGIRIGYSHFHNALLYRPDVPLTQPAECDTMDSERSGSRSVP
jgi:hypothetical protein